METFTQFALATENHSLSSRKKMPIMVSDRPTRVSVPLVKAPDNPPVEWCGQWMALPQPPAPSPAASYWSSPTMLRPASLSLRGKTEGNGERSSHSVKKGRSVLMRRLSLTDLLRESTTLLFHTIRNHIFWLKRGCLGSRTLIPYPSFCCIPKPHGDLIRG